MPAEPAYDGITITPSINNTVPGHGRKKTCTWHGSVVGGNVIDAGG